MRNTYNQSLEFDRFSLQSSNKKNSHDFHSSFFITLQHITLKLILRIYKIYYYIRNKIKYICFPCKRRFYVKKTKIIKLSSPMKLIKHIEI